MSFSAAVLRILLSAYTFPFRCAHKSLSRSVKLKNSPYIPPEGLEFYVTEFGGVHTEVVAPRGAACSDSGIIQFHGGGHTASMNDMYRKVAAMLAKECSCAVYSIDYVAGEKLVFPQVHEQCYNAYRKIIESKNIAAAVGDSFGAAVMLYCCLKSRNSGNSLPRSLVCVSPFVDMAASGESYRINAHRDPLYALPFWQSFDKYEDKLRRISPYCGNTPLKNELLSPAYAELDGFPDMLIISGGLETSASDGRMLCANALKAGVKVRLREYKFMWHDFLYMFPRLKESRQAFEEIFDFIPKHTK